MFARVSIVSCILAVALATSATPQYKRWGPSKRPSSCPTPVTETTTETATVTVTAASSGPTSITIDQCNTGAIQCCNTVTQGNTTFAQNMATRLGVANSKPHMLMGLDCSPISQNSDNEPACNASPICCENDAEGGLISIGCIIIEL